MEKVVDVIGFVFVVMMALFVIFNMSQCHIKSECLRTLKSVECMK